MAQADSNMEVTIMKRTVMNITNIVKKTVATLVVFATFSAMTISTNAFAYERPRIVDYSQVAHVECEVLGNGIIFDDDVWYDNYIIAWNHASFRVGQHAEFKHRWVPFYGWTTKGCTIIDVAVTEEKGKYAPIYKNDFNKNYYLDSAYEK